MKVRLRELKPNPVRDFNVDPLDEEIIERLRASIRCAGILRYGMLDLLSHSAVGARGTETLMATETQGVQFWQREAHEEAEKLRREARRLKEAGLSMTEIARRLNRHPQTVRDWFWTPDRARSAPNADHARMTKREKAEKMASVYPDRVRRQWVLKQMGVSDAD